MKTPLPAQLAFVVVVLILATLASPQRLPTVPALEKAALNVARQTFPESQVISVKIPAILPNGRQQEPGTFNFYTIVEIESSEGAQKSYITFLGTLLYPTGAWNKMGVPKEMKFFHPVGVHTNGEIALKNAIEATANWRDA